MTALIGDLVLYKTETHLFWRWYDYENLVIGRPHLKIKVFIGLK